MAATVVAKIFDYPRNAWYVAAWDHEVTRVPRARTVAGRPLALFRTEDGRPVALADACWHRLAPLSMGKVIGNEIQCPYHGLRYNPEGRWIIADEAAWLDSFGLDESRWDGMWSVLAFSIPESRRDLRHSARSRLKWLGYAPLYDGVWISPLDTAAEAMAELRDLGVEDVTSMRASVDTTTPGGPQSVWDLDEARHEYRAFDAELADSSPREGAAALAERSRLMLTWQRFRGLDVGLPREVLPEEWPRVAVRERFARRYDELGPEAEARMRDHVRAISPELVGAVKTRRLHQA